MNKTLVMALGLATALGVGAMSGALIERRVPSQPAVDATPATPPAAPGTALRAPPQAARPVATDVDASSLERFLSFAEAPRGSAATTGTAAPPAAIHSLPSQGTTAAAKEGKKEKPRQVSTAINTGDVSIRFTNVKNAQDLLLAVGDVAPLSCRPTARVVGSLAARPGSPLLLDGTASYDSCGLPLTYRWEVTQRPSGSSTAPACPDCALTVLVADRPGDYEVTLVVSNGRWDSGAAMVHASTSNSAPRAEAGPDVATRPGQRVTLDGTGSVDPDGDSLRYSWSLLERPAGSTAKLEDAESPNPSFEVDRVGTYVVRLVVTDRMDAASSPDEVQVTTENVGPIARPGRPQAVFTGTAVTLDGSASTDANDDPLRFRWAFVTRPLGSDVAIADAYEPVSSFVPDAAGLYVVGLVAHDGTSPSAPATLVIAATGGTDCALTDLKDAITALAKVDAEAFCSTEDATALAGSIAAAIGNVEAGDRNGARDLTQGTLSRVDGCALRGSVDPCRTPEGDWITTCDGQGEVYPLLVDALTCLLDTPVPVPQPPAPTSSAP